MIMYYFVTREVFHSTGNAQDYRGLKCYFASSLISDLSISCFPIVVHQSMNLNEFLSLLRRPDMSFIDAIETKEFQLMLEKTLFSYTLDGDLRWRLLYGLWVVLLDFADDPVSPWQPNKATIPGLGIFICKMFLRPSLLQTLISAGLTGQMNLPVIIRLPTIFMIQPSSLMNVKSWWSVRSKRD